MSASGSAITATPAPRALAIASRLTAYARLLRGISSAATTAIMKSRARPSGRPIACVATRSGNVGAIAPAAVTSGAANAIAVTTRRRPTRSASTATGSTSRIPARTIEPAIPRPASLTPKSSAAKFTVWVNSVLTNADDIDAAASRPSTVSARGSSRSGGAHHGVGAACSWAGWVGAAPRRASAHRTGRANTHANQGSDHRYVVVSRQRWPPSDGTLVSVRR